MGKKKQKDQDHDATREVLLWASENDLQETISAVLSVRKEHKYRGHSKEMYQVLLAEHPDRNIPSRLLVLKNDRVDKFEVQHKHCFEMKEIHTVRSEAGERNSSYVPSSQYLSCLCPRPAFEISGRSHCFPLLLLLLLRPPPQVEVTKDDGLQILTIRGSGERKSKWSCTSSSDLLHLVLSLQDEYAKETGGKKLAVSGIESSSVISRRKSDDDDDKAEDDAAANAAPNDKEDEAHGASGDNAMTRIEEDNLRQDAHSRFCRLDPRSPLMASLAAQISPILPSPANIVCAPQGDDEASPRGPGGPDDVQGSASTGGEPAGGGQHTRCDSG